MDVLLFPPVFSTAGLRLWDVATGQDVRQFDGHTDDVRTVAFSSDGRFAMSGSADRSVRYWEVATGKELRRLDGHTGAVRSVALSPDGRTAISGSEDTTLKVWDVETGKVLRDLKWRSSWGMYSEVTSVAFSPDGRIAAAGGSNTLPGMFEVGKIAKPLSCKRLPADAATYRNVSALAFSHDGRFIISVTGGGLILWNVATCREVQRF